MHVTDGTARPELARCFADHAAQTIAWMRDHGADFIQNARWSYGLPMLAPARRMSAGLDWEKSGPNLFLKGLVEQLEAADGRMLRETEAVSLVIEGGTCVGVDVVGPDGPRRIDARAVVLADGGFQANRALIGRHISPAPDRVRQRNVETAIGDALTMAESAGAALVGLDKFYGHVLSRDAISNAHLWPYPQVDVVCCSGIVVDATARRFTDEGLGGIALANAIAALADPLSATAIFDSVVWEEAKHADLVPPNPCLIDAGGTVFQADTIGEIAAAAGLDHGAVTQVISEHNDALAAGTLGGLAPPRTTRVQEASPIKRPPYYAIPLSAGITVTMGGIAVDGGARVVRPDGTPIPGLFAAGSCVGGVEGGPLVGYTGGLIKAFLLGLVAADRIVGDSA